MHGLDRQELARWVENRWVLPEQRGGAWLFHEVDVARVELIREIRHEFAIDDEAVPVVLGLLDQVYGLRRQLRRLCDALASQPQRGAGSDQARASAVALSAAASVREVLERVEAGAGAALDRSRG